MTPLKINTILIGSIICFILLANLIVGIKYLKQFSKPLKYLVAYLGVSFLAEVLSLIYFINADNNLWIINLYTIIEFVFIALFITQLTQKGSNKLNALNTITVIVVLGYVIYFSFFKSFFGFSSYSETFENVLLMAGCIYFLMYSLTRSPNCRPEEVKLVNWFIIAFFIYLSGTILIWLAYEFFLSNEEYKDFRNILLYFNGFLNFSFKIVTLIALLSFDHRTRRKKILGKSR